MSEVMYVRETDGALMMEVAPHQFVSSLWIKDRKLSVEESKRRAHNRAVQERNKANAKENDDD